MTAAELIERARAIMESRGEDVDVRIGVPFGIDLAYDEPAIGYTILEGGFIAIGPDEVFAVRGPAYVPRHRHRLRALASMGRT